MRSYAGSGRRRVYWGQEAGLFPPFSLSGDEQRGIARRDISADTIQTVGKGFFGGIGFALGLFLLRKILKTS